jgi:hypothetical protein
MGWSSSDIFLKELKQNWRAANVGLVNFKYGFALSFSRQAAMGRNTDFGVHGHRRT